MRSSKVRARPRALPQSLVRYVNLSRYVNERQSLCVTYANNYYHGLKYKTDRQYIFIHSCEMRT